MASQRSRVRGRDAVHRGLTGDRGIVGITGGAQARLVERAVCAASTTWGCAGAATVELVGRGVEDGLAQQAFPHGSPVQRRNSGGAV